MNGIDPKSVRTRKLASGDEMPAIGLGTFGSDRFSAAEVAGAVLGAARYGYRLFDCASVYGNEALIGGALADARAEGIRREELFVTSKVWNDMHKPADVETSLKKSLRDLRLDYIDLYFVHWPFRNYHAPFCDVNSRNPLSHPYNHAEFLETWAVLEKFHKQGFIKNLGTSNMTVPKLELLLRDCSVRPAASEMELHPCFQQPELFDYCMKHNIQPVGYCPIGSPNRPERDRTAEDVSDTEVPEVAAIAEKYGIHPATVCLKWAITRGQIPIPFSVKAKNYESNLRVAAEPDLTAEDMQLLEGADRNCRLIKGQVFLWQGAGENWNLLWDEDGKIAGEDK